MTDELGDVHPDALESVEVAKKQADKDNENCDGTDPDKMPDEQSTAGEGEAVVVANDSADGADNAQEIKSNGGNSDKSKSVELSVNADSVNAETVNAETVETDGNINNAESAEVKDDKKSDSDVKPTARRTATAAKSGGQAAKRKPTATKKATTKSTTDNPATPDKDEVAP